MIILSTRDEGGFFYYLALLIGMGLVGAYMWYILVTPSPYEVYNFIMYISGALLVATSFLFAYAKTRTSRVLMTVLSGIIGGMHFFLDIALYDYVMGLILFAWLAFGVLLSFAAFNWLLE